MKLALVDPAVTVILAGTVAADVLLLDSVTRAPPVGAAALKVTVPCEELPPTTLVGLSDSDASATGGGGGGGGGLTVSVALRETLLYRPEIEAVDIDVTLWLVTVKVAEVDPAGMVTLPGTIATEVLLLDKVTAAPPVGAAALSVTVPVEVVMPATVVGFKLKDASVAAGGGGAGSTPNI